MLAHEQIQDLDSDILNIDSFFANNDDDDDQDELWLTPLDGTAIDDDWFGTELNPLVQDDDETAAPHSKQPSLVKLESAKSAITSDAATIKLEPIKHEVCCISPSSERVKIEDDGYEEDDEHDDTADGCCGHYCAGEVASEAESFLDDATWLDFNRSPLASPPMMLPTREKMFANANAQQDEHHWLLSDETDDSLPELTDDEVCALVGSPPPGYSTQDSGASSSRAALFLAPPTPLQRKLMPAAAAHTAPSLSEMDIPHMVDLFSSMHSPSEAVRLSNARRGSSSASTVAHSSAASEAAAALSILVPTPRMYATMFPFGTPSSAAGSTAPVSAFAPSPASNTGAGTSSHHHTNSSSTSSNVNQFDYFTPPALATSGSSHLHTSLFLNAAETLSPATKSTGFATGAPPPPAPLQLQSHSAYTPVHALAIANSMSSMRRLSMTYGAPIVPLQRTLHPELKHMPSRVGGSTATASRTTTATSSSSRAVSSSKTLLHAATAGASKAMLVTAATSGGASASSKGVTKISITPDIADFKLVQIFHSFCDPASKMLTLARFHQLTLQHQGKDDAATAASKSSGGSTAQGALKATMTISPETQALFKVLDPSGTGVVDLERFMSSFQICNRCTEAKRRTHAAQLASQGQTCAATSALDRQLMADVSPVLVRVVPSSYEGGKVKSCEHYQWTWCEGFAKTGNEKCRGTNRHDKCPKYLANCTLWKHKLPPKNRKAKQVLELQESPSKKFKHFA